MALTDESIMTFGKKFAGEKMANVPASYLAWILRAWVKTPQNSELFKYIYENLDAIKLELEKEKKNKNE